MSCKAQSYNKHNHNVGLVVKRGSTYASRSCLNCVAV